MKCERCGKEFVCGRVDNSCWCFEIPTVNLNQEYKDCLCKECLTELYETSKTSNQG